MSFFLGYFQTVWRQVQGRTESCEQAFSQRGQSLRGQMGSCDPLLAAASGCRLHPDYTKTWDPVEQWLTTEATCLELERDVMPSQCLEPSAQLFRKLFNFGLFNFNQESAGQDKMYRLWLAFWILLIWNLSHNLPFRWPCNLQWIILFILVEKPQYLQLFHISPGYLFISCRLFAKVYSVCSAPLNTQVVSSLDSLWRASFENTEGCNTDCDKSVKLQREIIKQSRSNSPDFMNEDESMISRFHPDLIE